MATTVLQRGPVSVFDHRCGLGPDDKPLTEVLIGVIL
jgi:hypothetical protein